MARNTRPGLHAAKPWFGWTLNLSLPRLLRALVALAAGAMFCVTASGAAAFEDSLAQRAKACTACHGDQGKAGPDGYYPRLAGKPAAYLYHQLLNFRDDRRHYALMQGLLAPLNETYLWELAQYFSSLDLPYPPPTAQTGDKALLERGKTLALNGDAKRGLPACTQCHGTLLTGMLPQTPGLLGLPRDYINAQLGGWQTGQRQAHGPDCMAQIARKLQGQDISALALWLSSQPPPAAYKPASDKTLQAAAADIQCGKEQRPTAIEVLVPSGSYLARIGNCALCHTTPGGASYAGGKAIETPFGTVFSSNITPDRTNGIGAWSADDFWQALHHGKSRDGRLLYPAFPYTSYTHISREDSDALWAYLQSVPAAARANTPHALRYPYSTQWALRLWRMAFFEPAKPAATARVEPQMQRGAYLVQGLGHCAECHGKRNLLGAMGSGKWISGATLSVSGWYAPALDDAAEGGVGAWSKTEIRDFLQKGSNLRANASGPMAEVVAHSTQFLSDADTDAMGRHLQARSLSTVPRTNSAIAPAATLSPQGGALYERHCAECHGKNGEGRAGAYPALAGNRAITMARTDNLVQAVLRGGFAPATTGNSRPFGMPPFQLQLNDAQTAAVLTFIRSAWGNNAAPVSEFDINRQRNLQVR
ncbi:MAG: c-type cytochrome [Rhodoferax sp.]|nr:c-type cytochrome [Rhodoferax sp.]